MSEIDPNNTTNGSTMHTLSEGLLEDYQHQQVLMSVQPTMIQRFLEAQGAQIGQALVSGASQVKFTLPDRVVCTMEDVKE
ncbi:MAG TPA: hypothetical protein VIV15_12010, partial [Anaerolineales bacterium]